MDYLIHPILNEEEIKKIKDKLSKSSAYWLDGKKTAGSYAAKVKNNTQLEKTSDLALEIEDFMLSKLRANELIKSFSLPRKIHGLMVTKSSQGQGYGFHIDNAYMSSGRSDLSFTIFLSDNDDYDGGELCLQTIQEVKKIKLNAGEIIIYPSTSLHCVSEVTKGERLACIGWIQSYISNNEDRNMLFNLDAGAKSLLAKHGRSDELDLVFQAYCNMLRRLGD